MAQADSPTGREQQQGRPVELPDHGDESTLVFANPDGTFSAQLHAAPVRVRRATGWVPIDATLARRPDGSIGPKATTADLTFGIGGGEDLIRLRKGDGEITFTWPGGLPAPVLRGDSATYPEVLPGVDLVVKATATGFSELLVVKNARAASDPALRQISFGVRSRGLFLDGDTITSGDGKPVARSGNAWMWESSGRRRLMRVHTTNAALTVVPDPELLTDARTQYPLMIDPAFESRLQHYLITNSASGSTGTGLWDWDGNEAIIGGLSSYRRTYLQLYTAPVAGKHVTRATFRAFQSRADSCTPVTMEIWWSATINASQSWSNPPSLISKLTQLSTAKGFSAACPAGDIQADITPMMAQIASGSAATLTLGLKLPETGFAGSIALPLDRILVQVDYNTIPGAPTELTNAGKPCASMTLPTATPQLSTRLTDLDGTVRAVFEWWNSAGTTRIGTATTAFSASGATHSTTVPAGAMAHGGSYRWRVQANDGVDSGAWSPWCLVTIDTAPPSAAPTITSALFPEGGFGAPAFTSAAFTFSAGGNPDVVAFGYSDFGSDVLTHQIPAAAPGGSATVILTPTTDGPQSLNVAGIDAAGNIGPAANYFFFADTLPGPSGQWHFDEGAGAQAFDSSGSGNTASLFPGASFGTGRSAGDLTLDGDAGFASTSSPVVQGSASFTVMAWVQLRNKDSWWTAVSQDGGDGSLFELRYGSFPAGWEFAVFDGTGTTSVFGDTTAQANVWTHLAGVYDKTANQLRIYVNGRLAGVQSYTGTLVASTAPLRLGRANWFGFPVRRWPGAIDDAAVYQRAVSQIEIQAVMAGDPFALTGGSWALDEGTGTSAADSSGNGHTLALSAAGSSWTAGKSGPAMHLDGAAGHAYTAGPVVRTNAGFTASAWVRLSAGGAAAAALSQDGAVNSGFSLGFAADTGRWRFAMASTDAAGSTWVSAPADGYPQMNLWTHLAGVFDAEAGQLLLYVNGRLAGTATGRPAWSAGRALIAGRAMRNGGPVEFWPGDIDSVKLVDQALPAPAIAQLTGDSYGANAIWNFSEGTGTVAADSSGGNQTLSRAGDASWTAGLHGSALQLDGAGDYAFTAGPVLRTDRSLAVDAWVKLTSSTGSYGAVAQRGPSGGNGFLLGYSSSSGKWHFVMSRQDSTDPAAEDRAVAEVPPQLNTWTHLAGVFDAGLGRMRIYVNGILAGQADHTPTWNATGQLIVGLGDWPGAIDEVRTHDFAATGGQVRADAGGLPEIGAAGVVSRFKFVHSGLCLTDSGSSMTQGACPSVAQAQSLAAANFSASTYRVLSFTTAAGALCLGVSGGSAASGAATLDAPCAPGQGQLFALQPTILPVPGVRFQAVHSGLCLAVAAGSTTSGAQVVQQACSVTSAAQVLSLEPVGAKLWGFSYGNHTTFPIADNSTVESEVWMSRMQGSAPTDARVEVDITHTYRGDLILHLIAPDGTAYLLDDPVGPGANLVATYTLNLSGENAGGTWTLRVSDQAGGDVGTLNGWTLVFSTVQVLPPATFGAWPATPIPDLATVQAQFRVTGVDITGVDMAYLTVGITHTCRGDLDVRLISPDNTTYQAERATGCDDNLRRVYLFNFDDTSVDGTWTLVVRDLASADAGTLDFVALSFAV